MNVDTNGYDTRSAKSMDLYLPRCSREHYKSSFLYKGNSLWNQLPSCLKESISIIDFKRNYRVSYGWRLFWEFWCLCMNVLYFIWNFVMLARNYVRISTSNIYFHLWVHMCIIFVCIFSSVTAHYGRAVWLNGPPSINIFEMKQIIIITIIIIIIIIIMSTQLLACYD